ncbi:MAG: UDP-N-acetylglucosamine--N-acetylmuramyl-(pentapeptide) pyrophosphoryl-undecaprenol N-acetylglucosamine transferase [Clostridiales bacterium]|jgi:UDP-N-acetylglucosamine--N-acetylmuramyl-(pentapeptide) pyrophosphoryl-undecaprenol N-acetylglucosamine transferase|nr:UDP-N-acetylglucosamine--N-acetylmuramyl-(pentapeptide) pyrophosphoryl-undecaprenol N-acetylglucosamine transferase [Clostridiales bacterium]
MTIVLTGGGTAGHIMPNLALIPYLERYFDKIYYIGETDGMEQTLAQKYGVAFFGTPAVKFDRGKPLKNLKIPAVLPKAVKEARAVLRGLKPDIVYSKGGYAALPAALAARSLKIPVIAHESDMSMGLANKLTAKFCKKVFLGFETDKYKNDKKYIFTGTPVRDGIFGYQKPTAKNSLGIPEKLPVILIIGGSLGAKAVNQCVYSCLDRLTKTAFVLHIAGKTGKPSLTRPNYRAFEFYDRVGELFAAADVVVSRAGATAAAELFALNKKVIFIPLPKTASRGDQLLNAEYYKAKNAAEVILQENLDADSLIAAVERLLALPEKTAPRPRPNADIARLIYETAKTK